MSLFLKTATLVLAPAVIIQGLKVKKNTPRLAEPAGLRSGRLGSGTALSVLIIGDSAAAGVGVESQSDALSGALANILQQDFELEWLLHAKTGDCSTRITQQVQQLETQSFDVVITSVGVNDVTKFKSAKKWIQQQKTLYALIQNKSNPKLIIAAGVPPMQLFPALPNPLAWLFGQYAKAMNHELEQFVQTQPNMYWIKYDLQKFQQLNLEMARDGFHPSKEIYQLWAEQLAEQIRTRFLTAKFKEQN